MEKLPRPSKEELEALGFTTRERVQLFLEDILFTAAGFSLGKNGTWSSQIAVDVRIDSLLEAEWPHINIQD